MSRFRIWVCKRIHNHIEYLKKSVEDYEKKMSIQMKYLSAFEVSILAIDLGYAEEKDFKKFQRRYK